MVLLFLLSGTYAGAILAVPSFMTLIQTVVYPISIVSTHKPQNIFFTQTANRWLCQPFDEIFLHNETVLLHQSAAVYRPQRCFLQPAQKLLFRLTKYGRIGMQEFQHRTCQGARFLHKEV